MGAAVNVPGRRRRGVVVTGLGMVTAAGADADAVWRSIGSGICAGTRGLDRFDVSRLPTRIAAPAADFDPVARFGSRRCQDMDRVSQLALCATEQALEAAGLPEESGSPHCRAVCFGTGLGGIQTTVRAAEVAARSATARLHPLTIPMAMNNASAFQIARRIGAHGPNLTFSAACSSGSLALGAALRMIQRSDVDLVVVCAADAPLVPVVFRAWCALRAMTTRNGEPAAAFRPFDSERDGFVLGEGAGAVVCEARDRALARGAPIYGELLGFGSSCDAASLTAPAAEHQAVAMRRAIGDAGIQPSGLGFIVAHGTATRLNDVTEGQAIREALGAEAAGEVPVVAYKPYFGHTMGACGVIEFITGLLSVSRGALHGTPNLTAPDPACAVRHAPRRGATEPGATFMCNSFGFGGSNAVLIGRGAPNGRQAAPAREEPHGRSH